MTQGIQRSRAMRRAVKIFPFETRESDSPFVEKIWRTKSVPYEAFISVAVTHWEMVIWKQDDWTHLTVRGPETKASNAAIPEGAEFFGIEFSLGAFMPSLPVAGLVDGELNLPESVGHTFRLNHSAWDFPNYGNAEVFVKKLAREGLLVRDPVVVATLKGRSIDLSRRSIERRVLKATGLTRGAIRQIERAARAAELLDAGATILDTVERTGYADQAHLTRSLRRFIGQTPAEIAAEPN